MSTQENKALIRRYGAALNQDKSPETINKYVADPTLIEHIAFFEAAFPNYQMITEDLIAEGDKVTLRGAIQATHKGDLMGIPPTGKEATFSIFITYRIADGKIVEHWILADQMSMLKQLGVA